MHGRTYRRTVTGVFPTADGGSGTADGGSGTADGGSGTADGGSNRIQQYSLQLNVTYIVASSMPVVMLLICGLLHVQ